MKCQLTSVFLSAYCDSIGVSFNVDILKWEPGEVEGWEAWPGWHDSALKSTGFSMHSSAKLSTFEDLSAYPDEVENCVNNSMSIYQNLIKYKISPKFS